MTSTYVPQPGTVTAKALAHLIAVYPQEVAGVPLAEAIGQPADYTGLPACLSTPMHHGYVVRRKEGHLAYWSATELALGLEIQAEAPEGAKPRVNQHTVVRTAVSPEPQQPEPQAPSFPVEKPEVIAPHEVPPAPALVPGMQQVEAEFDCALSASGKLLIEDGQHRLQLTVEKTKRLLRYLDRLRADEDQGVAA